MSPIRFNAGVPKRITEDLQAILGSGRRHDVINLADRLRLPDGLRPLHDRGRQSLTILGYHRIVPADKLVEYPLDLELVSTTPREFKWQMNYIRRHMNPVSLGAVADALDRGTELPPRAVAITFDDGFADTYKHAFPILHELGIPATVFIATGFIDSGQPFWFELAAYLMMHAKPNSISVPGMPDGLPTAPSARARRADLHRLQQFLKASSHRELASITAKWSERLAGLIDDASLAAMRPLNWDEISAMAANGIEIGSHSVSHPNLAQLSENELGWELVQSARTIEARLGRPPATLAYPIGTPDSFNVGVAGATRESGYRLALTYLPGTNWSGSIHKFMLRRQGLSLWKNRAYFRTMMTLPDWIH